MTVRFMFNIDIMFWAQLSELNDFAINWVNDCAIGYWSSVLFEVASEKSIKAFKL